MYRQVMIKIFKESGYDCHLNGIYMGVLAYADAITITCPSRRGLHKMLVLCNNLEIKIILFLTRRRRYV